MQTDLMQTLRWMRVPGDTLFFRRRNPCPVRSRPEDRTLVSQGRGRMTECSLETFVPDWITASP